ncbi:MAG: PH domain-containing protein [Cellulomonadaceae bacterium]|nr:PH domain-containing protein [Cellulomonadaceae bacterium]
MTGARTPQAPQYPQQDQYPQPDQYPQQNQIPPQVAPYATQHAGTGSATGILTGGTPPTASLADGNWHHMHPVTPLVRGWTLVVAMAGFLLFEIVAGGSMSAAADFAVRNILLVALATVVLIALVVGYLWLVWHRMEYSVVDDVVRLRQGILFRQQRDARLDRVQAIDIRQPLVARIFGLAELTFESAGGAGSQIQIGFLRASEANHLRGELLARAAGLRAAATSVPTALPASAPIASAPGAPMAPTPAAPAFPAPAADSSAGSSSQGITAPISPTPISTTPIAPAPTTPAFPASITPEAPERQVLAVPFGRLLGSVAMSGTMWFLLLIVIAAIVGAVVAGPAVLATVLPVFIGVGAVVYSVVNGSFNFKAAISPDGIRLRRGLTTTQAQTIPPGRIQAVQISQSPLWRLTDWWRVRVTIAGYNNEEDTTQQQNVLLPVGSREEARTALWLVLPDLGTEDPIALLDEGMTGTRKNARFFTNAPKRARWVNPFSWWRNAFGATDRAVFFRGGWLNRTLSVVPHERSQSLCVVQGPVARALRVAKVRAHVSSATMHPTAYNVDAEDASRLIQDEARAARAARATQTPEQWMASVGG